MGAPNPAKRALRERMVLHVTIWDQSRITKRIAHEFTTLATVAEAQQITTDWLEPVKASGGYTTAEMSRWFPYVIEPLIKRRK